MSLTKLARRKVEAVVAADAGTVDLEAGVAGEAEVVDAVAEAAETAATGIETEATAAGNESFETECSRINRGAWGSPVLF